MNKILRRIFIALTLFALPLVVTGCGCYSPDFEYKAVDPGQLKAPEGGLADYDAYREKYAELGRYDEEITITVAAVDYTLEPDVKAGTSPETQTFNKIAKDVLNINLEYVVIGGTTQYDTKLKTSIAAGIVPDMFYTTDTALYSSLLESGKLADLSDAFWYLNDDLQQNYLKYFPELLPTTMVEGKLYSFPSITNNYASAQRLYIRQDWLDVVGMEAPTNMEEFVAVAKAFTDKKAEIAAATGIKANRLNAFTMTKQLTWAGSYSIEGFLNCFGTSVNSYFEGNDGELYYSNTSSEMKDALSTLRDLYQYGALDNEFISKSSDDIQSDIKSGYVGMAFGEWWMAKDVLDDCITNVKGADWTWVDLPGVDGTASPIVKSVGVGGYNLVSSTCKYPEAAAKLINLFYDIYYSDDAQTKYGSDVLPSNGFYYQFVPIKLWDGVSSLREYERVQSVFNNLYELGFDPSLYVDSATYAEKTILQEVAQPLDTDYLVSTTITSNKTTYNIINRDVINAINANPAWKAEFDKMRLREIKLHFVDGYPYFVAYKNGKNVTEMTKGEKRGWGIYHEMVDKEGGYGFVVDLTNGVKTAKFDCFYGANLSAMETYLEYISSQTDQIFTNIIKGEVGINEFESKYVQAVFNNNGGETIMTQVNAWYDAHTIDYDKVYELVADYIASME